MRTLISVGLITVSLVIAMYLTGSMVRNRPTVQPRDVAEPRYNVDVFAVSAIDFRERLAAFGTARADREVVLAAQVAGEITELNPEVRTGRPVSAGRMEADDGGPTRRIDPELLIRIDPRDYQERVEQAEATIRSSQTEIAQLQQQQQNLRRQLEVGREDVATLKSEYERIAALRERGAGSASDLSNALLQLRGYEDTIIQLENQATLLPHQIETAKQRLATATSEKQRAQNDLERTAVTAPFDGVIGEVNVEQGQYVRAGEPLLRLIDPERIEVSVALGMDDYLLLQGPVQAGQQPRAHLSENESNSPRWTGKVVRVAPAADASSRTIDVFIEVLNSEQQQPLLPGTFVFAWIDGPEFADSIIVPREAVVDEQVYVVGADNRAEARAVRTGRRLRSMVVVEEGLQAGDQVVLTNLDIVRNGTVLSPQPSVSVHDELTRQRVNTIERLDEHERP